MKFFRKNGEPAMNTNSGRLLIVKAKSAPEQFCEQGERDQPHGADSANTSHTGTLAVNSETTAPISARFVKPK